MFVEEKGRMDGFEKRKLQKRESIRRAALELFQTYGFEKVSIGEIARRAGVSQVTIYNHFESKDAILEEIFEHFQSELASLTPSNDIIEEVLEGDSPEKYLRDWFMRFIEFWDDPRRERIWFITSMEQHRNKKVAEMILRETGYLLDVTERILQKLVEKKRVKPFEPRLLAAEYVYTLRAMHLEYRLLKVTKQNTEDIEKLMSDHIEFFLERIKNDKKLVQSTDS